MKRLDPDLRKFLKDMLTLFFWCAVLFGIVAWALCKNLDLTKTEEKPKNYRTIGEKVSNFYEQ